MSRTARHRHSLSEISLLHFTTASYNYVLRKTRCVYPGFFRTATPSRKRRHFEILLTLRAIPLLLWSVKYIKSSSRVSCKLRQFVLARELFVSGRRKEDSSEHRNAKLIGLLARPCYACWYFVTYLRSYPLDYRMRTAVRHGHTHLASLPARTSLWMTTPCGFF